MRKRVPSRLLLLASVLLISAAGLFAQDEDTSFIDDPFAVPEDSEDNTAADPFADAFLDPFADPDAADSEAADSEADAESGTEGSDSEQADPMFDDLDSMFNTDSMVDEIDEEEASADVGAADEFLLTEGVEFGGKFSGNLSSSFDYDYLWTPDFDITDPNQSMTPSVSADLFFDARPVSDYRVFGKLSFATASGTDQQLADIIPEDGLTFTTSTDADGNTTFQTVDPADVDPNDPNQTTITQQDAQNAQGGTSTQLNISVKELFADFDWENRLYFRFGKSLIKWGVGYFWSPSDVLNLTTINAEDPTAEREGPVSFKIHYPFDINNAYLYAITENVQEPLDTAIASKVELVIGETEIGLGGYYQRDLAPRAVATVSTSIGDFAVFGEGVASWGSDRVFVRPSKDQSAAEDDPEDALKLVLDTYTVDDRPFFSATIGTNYMHEFDDDAGSFMFVGQYFFNGEGYDNSIPGLLEAAYRLNQNAGENGLAVDTADQPEGYEDPPALGTSDLTNFGRHYVGAVVSWSSILGSDLSFSVLGLANLTDLSGIVSPNFSYKIIDYISVSAGMRMTFGEEGDEYTNPIALLGLSGENSWKGPTMSFSLECSIGGGSF